MEVNEWVVVASRAQAKIFKRTDTTRPLKWIYTLVNKEGASGLNGEAEVPRVPHDEVSMERFAKKIANTLKIGADHHSYTKLHVFAEPHLLGRVKQNIPKCMKRIEIEWIGKDLEKATAQEILERVS